MKFYDQKLLICCSPKFYWKLVFEKKCPQVERKERCLNIFIISRITNQLIKHDRAMKLITPFLITSVIESMTATKRSTTLHDKVKNIFKNICYSLIDIIDSHHHKFILRSSEEATRDIYNLLYKEYQKFRAFRGKI